MSQYVKVLQHNGGFISLLADDDGVIQYTTNDGDFDGIVSGTATDADHATTADSATTATAADGPTVAATFSTALAAGDDVVTTLAAPGTTIDVTGLTGATDGDYEISGTLLLTGSGSPNSVTFQPQADSGNAIGIVDITNVIATSVTVLYISNFINTADSSVYFHGTFQSKAGRDRAFFSTAFGTITAGTREMTVMAGAWTSTATALTSLRIVASQGMRTGSYFRVRKLRNLT